MKRIFLTLYLIFIIATVVLTVTVFPLIDKFFYSDILDETRELAKGTFYLVVNELKSLEQDKWEDRIKQLQPFFGYPIKLHSMQSLKFQEKAINDLYAGKIVEDLSDESLYQRLFNSNFVFSMGPFPDLKNRKLIDFLFWVVIAVFLAIPILLWSLLLWRDVRQITRVAKRFGKGDFCAKAQVFKFSSLYVLANTFNDMGERIRQLVTSHKDLTNAVSHELRTPLARMKFSLGMLESENNLIGNEELLRGLYSDVGELEELVDELLAFAKFERDGLSGECISRDIVEWLKELVHSTGQKIIKTNISLRFKTSINKLTVKFEPHYFERALCNIIYNAERFAKNKIEVTLEMTASRYLIHIDDDGLGIPEDKKHVVFEPFKRLDNSRNKQTGGHGLGLAIVKQIVLFYNGEVFVSKSNLGGARFTLVFPRDIAGF